MRFNEFTKQPVSEGMLDNPGAEDSPVAQAIIRRILLQRTDLLGKYGPEKVGQAVDEVAGFVGDVDEIGSSDVSGWIRHVEQMLGNMGDGVAEGAPIVVMPRADRLKKAESTKVRYQGDIVPPTKPPSTEKRGVKGRPGQRPMPEQGVAEGIMNKIANKVMGAAPEKPKYKVGQRVKYETSPDQPDWKDGGSGVGVITAYKNGHYMINGNPVNHFEIKGVVEQGVAEGSREQVDSATVWEVSFDYGPHQSDKVKVRASSQEEAEQKGMRAAKKLGHRFPQLNWAMPAEQGVAEGSDPEQEQMDANRSFAQRREREHAGSEKIDAALAAQDAQRREYEQSGKFWLKYKDSQKHVSAENFIGKAAANAAAQQMIRAMPEVKGNLLITAYGPNGE